MAADANQKYAIGVDLGGTKIEVALMDSTGKIEKSLRVSTDVAGGHSAIENQIITTIRHLCPKSFEEIEGVGVGVAGQVELSTGRVHLAPNLGWRDVDFQFSLTRKLGIPVAVINDVRAATWGEWLLGAGKGCDDLVCLFVGTGIGAGVISGGEMLVGATNSAGELGHTVIDWKGVECTCGNRGCFESIAGGWGIARRAKEAVRTHPTAATMLLDLADGKIENITAKITAEANREGDPLAKKIFEETAEALIAGCTSIVNAFNPERLILGGGVIEGTPTLIKEIEEGVRKRALPVAVKNFQVLPHKLGEQTGVIGAGIYVFQECK